MHSLSSFPAVLSSATRSIFDSYSVKSVPLCWVPDSDLTDFVLSIMSSVVFKWHLVILPHIQNTAIIIIRNELWLL